MICYGLFFFFSKQKAASGFWLWWEFSGVLFRSFWGGAFAPVGGASPSHATPAEHVVLGWAEKVPPGFHFALKLPQELTPEARPVDRRGAAPGKFAARALLPGDKLGPLLVQPRPPVPPPSRDAIPAVLAALPAGPP